MLERLVFVSVLAIAALTASSALAQHAVIKAVDRVAAVPVGGVPELDPAAGTAALVLLLGGAAVMLERRRRRA